jgi:CheY-like chemotaxis protein
MATINMLGTKNDSEPGAMLRRSVLIVEDDPQVREALVNVLKSEDYNVVSASSGIEAIALCQGWSADVVLLDLNLQREEGWAVVRQLKQMHPMLPVIVTSARADRLANAPAALVCGSLEKPFDIPVLLGLLDHACNLNRVLPISTRPAQAFAAMLLALFIPIAAFCQTPEVVNPATITAINLRNGNAIVSWQGGGGTNQLQRATSLAGPWQNVGQPTTSLSATNPLSGPIGFFRVATPVSSVSPVVNLTTPIGGSTIIGNMPMAATATEAGGGVRWVEFYCDSNVYLGSATNTPYGMTYNSVSMANGTHSLYAKAYDAAGNSATSASVSVTVNNPAAGPWAERLGGSSTDMGQAVTTDASGNIILAGVFYSATDLGNGPLNSAGGYDIYLAKLSPAGAPLWSKRFGGTGNEYVTSIALDASGNIFVGGYFNGTNDFGLGQHISSYGYDGYVAKFSSSGVPVWEKTYGSTGVGAGYDSVTGVAADSSGNVIVTGFFQGNQIDLGAGTQWNGAASYDSFLLKLAGSNGANMWSRVYACDSDNQASGVAVDANGDIVVVGKLSGSVDLSNNTGVLPYPHPATTLGTAGSSDIYVGKFASDGTYQWSERFGGGQLDNAMGVAVDRSRNIFIVGYFTASMNMGIGSLSTAGTTDPFVAKLTPSGACVWAKSLAGGNNQSPVGIAVDGSGNVSITGYFDVSINLGAGVVSSAARFQNTSFVAKYSGSASGINPSNYLWSQVLLGTGANQPYAITTDPSGYVISTGFFMGNATLGTQTLINAGAFDAFLLRSQP